MKNTIKITRSFSKTIQITQFHPVSFSCTLEQEVSDEITEVASEALAAICVEQVEYDLANYLKVEPEKPAKPIHEEYSSKGKQGWAEVKSGNQRLGAF